MTRGPLPAMTTVVLVLASFTRIASAQEAGPAPKAQAPKEGSEAAPVEAPLETSAAAGTSEASKTDGVAIPPPEEVAQEEDTQPATPPPQEVATEENAQTATPPPAPLTDEYSGVQEPALVEEPPPKKNFVFGVGLDLSLPVGKTADYVGNVSLQGFSLEFRYYAWENWGIGAGIAFNSVSEKTSEDLLWENLTFSSVQVRELSFMPITVKAVHAWRDEEKLVPYVAAGVGAARVVQRLASGISTLSDSSWHLALVPEVGSYIPLGPTVVFANIRLNYLPPSGGQTEQIYGNLTFGVTVQ